MSYPIRDCCTFSFDHLIVSPSSSYWFWLPPLASSNFSEIFPNVPNLSLISVVNNRIPIKTRLITDHFHLAFIVYYWHRWEDSGVAYVRKCRQLVAYISFRQTNKKELPIPLKYCFAIVVFHHHFKQNNVQVPTLYCKYSLHCISTKKQMPKCKEI